MFYTLAPVYVPFGKHAKMNSKSNRATIVNREAEAIPQLPAILETFWRPARWGKKLASTTKLIYYYKKSSDKREISNYFYVNKYQLKTITDQCKLYIMIKTSSFVHITYSTSFLYPIH